MRVKPDDDEKAEVERYARVRAALETCATLEELARSWFYVSPDEWTLAQQDELRRLVCARLAVLGAPAPKTLVEVFAETIVGPVVIANPLWNAEREPRLTASLVKRKPRRRRRVR